MLPAGLAFRIAVASRKKNSELVGGILKSEVPKSSQELQVALLCDTF
jgi:hypothetical protein